MRKINVAMLIGLTGVAACQLAGCNISALIPPVELHVNTDFDVQAGVPSQKTVQFSAMDFPVDFSGGTIDLDPSMITVTPSDASGSKSSLAHQDGVGESACLDVCGLAGVDATTCSNVCSSGELAITIWVGSPEDIVADCGNGDEYQFRVTLDGESQPVSVTATPSSLLPATRALMNAGSQIAMCIEVISPIDASVSIGTFVLHMRL